MRAGSWRSSNKRKLVAWRRRFLSAVMVGGLCAGCWAAPAWSVTVRHYEKVLPLAAGGTLSLENVAGDVRVVADSGHDVRVKVTETVDSDAPDRVAEARRLMPLKATHDGAKARVFVDSPDRSRRGWDSDHRNSRDIVRYDLVVRVPQGVRVEAGTVLDGAVEVKGVTGFRASNVNGPVSLTDVSGSGEASTVNGTLVASFARNPDGPCRFATVNGSIEVALPAKSAADLRFHTLNGEIYTDFPYSNAPLPAPETRRKHGRFILRQRYQSSIQIAGGGPKLSFETVNGNILIRNRDRERSRK